MDWSWRHTVSRICHGGIYRGISLLHHRGNGEDSGTEQSRPARWQRRGGDKDARQREKGGKQIIKAKNIP